MGRANKELFSVNSPASFHNRVDACLEHISPAEQCVARFFQDNREEVLIASASALAQQTGTSDATVVRTVKALGFAGMEELRRTLARELKENLSPASRMARTLSEVGDNLEAALDVTLDIHQKSLEDLRRDITPDDFRHAVHSIVGARRTFIFGIGPSSAMADYFMVQLGRFGIDALSLTQTGLLLADGLQKLREGDLLILFAYGRVYRELDVLLDQADRCGVAKILFSDSLGPKLRDRVDLVLPVARGRADMLSMHTATLALIEALLVGIATERSKETIANLESLNKVRTALAGKTMDLPIV
jgi:DNA-binding MurR/RpiR family transcriptional regulator